MTSSQPLVLRQGGFLSVGRLLAKACLCLPVSSACALSSSPLIFLSLCFSPSPPRLVPLFLARSARSLWNLFLCTRCSAVAPRSCYLMSQSRLPIPLLIGCKQHGCLGTLRGGEAVFFFLLPPPSTVARIKKNQKKQNKKKKRKRKNPTTTDD